MSRIIRMRKEIFENLIEEMSFMSSMEEADKLNVAEAMYDSYRGTADYENDTVESFLEEIDDLENGLYGSYIKEASLCVKKTDEVLAGLFITDFKGKPTLTYLFTKKYYQNLGIAKELILASETVLYRKGYKYMYIYLNLDNVAAFNLFDSLGFEEVELS